MSRNISVRIDEELERLIEEEQEKLPYDVPKSEIVRTALKEHLSGNARVGATAT